MTTQGNQNFGVRLSKSSINAILWFIRLNKLRIPEKQTQSVLKSQIGLSLKRIEEEIPDTLSVTEVAQLVHSEFKAGHRMLNSIWQQGGIENDDNVKDLLLEAQRISETLATMSCLSPSLHELKTPDAQLPQVSPSSSSRTNVKMGSLSSITGHLRKLSLKEFTNQY